MKHWIWFVCCLFLLPNMAHAKKGYTKAQAEAIAKAECKKKIKKAWKKDKWLKGYNKKKRKWKKNGYCKYVKVTEKTKKCKRNCKRHLIRRIRRKCEKKNKCRIVTKTKRVKMCAIRTKSGKIEYRVQGKKKRRFGKLRKFTKRIGKGFKNAEKKMKALAKKAKARSKKIADKISKVFKAAIAAFKRKCKRIAKKLANSSKFKKRLAGRLAAIAFTKVAAARTLSQSKFRTKLLQTLSSSRNLTTLQRTRFVKQSALRTTKSFGKTAAISIGLAIAFTSATVAVECWSSSGEKKRRCLSKAITNGMRELSFNVLAAIVQVAVDLNVIEPVSHTLAAAVSAAAAAATLGIGAAAYPIAYLASSFSLNAALAVGYEALLRPRYERMFNSKFRPSVARFVSSLVARIPVRSLKCHGPKRLCRN